MYKAHADRNLGSRVSHPKLDIAISENGTAAVV